MAPPKVPAPSKIDALSFPVFGLSWYGTPSVGSDAKNNAGVSALAYCGGGGSSKTGVFNKIAVILTSDSFTGGSTERVVEISTGEALCFGIHLFGDMGSSSSSSSTGANDAVPMVQLLACVGDEVFLYGIPIIQQSESDDAVLLASVNIGQGYGASVTTYTQIYKEGQIVHCVAVGCENGIICLYELQSDNNNKVVSFVKTAECQGHNKAICAIHFHPRGTEILSSAKDGTARIFSTANGEQIGFMECEIHDPNGPAPLKPKEGEIKPKDPRMMKRPPQILVRGCAYGDLEGRTIYTIASGKRGAAYLTKWKTLVPLGGGAPHGGDAQKQLSIRQEYRILCSPVPISATALSPDGNLLSLGSVEGSIILYNLETQKVVKTFQGHDLPVTCLASRPIDNVLMLPGELEGGVNYDVVSASADNRLGRWTLQRKSRIQPVRQKRSRREVGAVESLVWSVLRIPLLVVMLIVMVAIHDIFDICQEEVGLSALMMDLNAARHCVYREVLWADPSRPGVRSVPE
jgi:hypothetical protein